MNVSEQHGSNGLITKSEYRDRFVEMWNVNSSNSSSCNLFKDALEAVEALTYMAERGEVSPSLLRQHYCNLSEALEMFGSALDNVGSSPQPQATSKESGTVTAMELIKYVEDMEYTGVGGRLRNYLSSMISASNASPSGEPSN